MPRPAVRSWMREHGSITTDVKDAQRDLGVGLDAFTADVTQVAAFESVVSRFRAVLDRAAAVPSVPDAHAAALYAGAIAAWQKCASDLAAGARARDIPRVAASQQELLDGGRQWGQFGDALESLNDLHRDRWRPGPARQPSGRHALIDLRREQFRATLPGMVAALSVGIVGYIALGVWLSDGASVPVLVFMVTFLLSTALLGFVAWAAVVRRMLPRFTDLLVVDEVGVYRTRPDARFDVPWTDLKEVALLTGETFRGETSALKMVTRRTGSTIAIRFEANDLAAFGSAHPGLVTGAQHDRFPALRGQLGCMLGVLTKGGQRTLADALKERAPRLWSGTYDFHQATRIRGSR
ncbi:MAG TPA: hypothetical protein VHX59_25045 [Mycobacteriales bacterium]|nr:hypothetical protein [Mycobacteriales bacterium]